LIKGDKNIFGMLKAKKKKTQKFDLVIEIGKNAFNGRAFRRPMSFSLVFFF
jgi:hypothetical protein